MEALTHQELIETLRDYRNEFESKFPQREVKRSYESCVNITSFINWLEAKGSFKGVEG